MFGRIKAKMILESVDVIQSFAIAQNPESLLRDPIVRRPAPDLTMQLQTFAALLTRMAPKSTSRSYASIASGKGRSRNTSALAR